MEDGEHGEGSNSQNDNLIITDIQKRGAPINCIKVMLSDGSSFFVFKSLWGQRYFDIGSEIQQDEIAELKRLTQFERVRDTSHRLLANREHSRRELELKLRKRRFDTDVIADVVSALEKHNLIDDERFTRLWIESRLKKHPEGKINLIANLKKRGVSSATIQTVVAEFENAAAFRDALQRALKQIVRKRRSTKKQIVSSLKNRGFSYGDIVKVLEELNDEGNFFIS